jgi:glycosyltransferase involved in cell wall biosynthesis
MCGILKQCDIVVNPIVGSSVATIINKHGDYAAAGKPVLNTQAGQEYRRLVEGYRMGFNCRNHDPADLAEKLEILLKDPGLRLEMGRNARRCAEEKFDRAKSYGRLQEVILQKDRDA